MEKKRTVSKLTVSVRKLILSLMLIITTRSQTWKYCLSRQRVDLGMDMCIISSGQADVTESLLLRLEYF